VGRVVDVPIDQPAAAADSRRNDTARRSVWPRPSEVRRTSRSTSGGYAAAGSRFFRAAQHFATSAVLKIAEDLRGIRRSDVDSFLTGQRRTPTGVRLGWPTLRTAGRQPPGFHSPAITGRNDEWSSPGRPDSTPPHCREPLGHRPDTDPLGSIAWSPRSSNQSPEKRAPESSAPGPCRSKMRHSSQPCVRGIREHLECSWTATAGMSNGFSSAWSA
jgi:hypothetical protein